MKLHGGRHRKRLVAGAIAVAMLALPACGGSSGKSDAFFDGKTIEILVSAKAGGGSDVVARMLIPYLKQHIEGNPNLQVVNIGGGAGVVGANEFAHGRKSDGTHTYLSSGSPHLPYFLGDPTIKFDFSKMVPVVGTSAGAVVYVSKKTGIKSAADLAGHSKTLHMGAQLATGPDITALVAWKLLGIKVKTTFGYEGKGPVRVAFEQGEADIDWQATPAYLASVVPLVKEGKAVPIMTFGQIEGGKLVRDPAFPDLPTVGEVYKQLHGSEPSGPAWDAYKTLVSVGWSLQKVLWFHDDDPKEAIEAVEAAVAELQNDEEFRKKREEALGPYPIITGQALTDGVEALTHADNDVVDWVHTFLEDEYDVEKFD